MHVELIQAKKIELFQVINKKGDTLGKQCISFLMRSCKCDLYDVPRYIFSSQEALYIRAFQRGKSRRILLKLNVIGNVAVLNIHKDFDHLVGEYEGGDEKT